MIKHKPISIEVIARTTFEPYLHLHIYIYGYVCASQFREVRQRVRAKKGVTSAQMASN